MKVDILVFAAHPDDAELACSGTIAKHVAAGKKVGIVDLTQGELGTRGTAELRKKEAEKSSKILGLTFRDNLGFADGFFIDDKVHLLAVITKIRQYKPEIVLANSINDRHPDHGRAAKLVADACFYSGLLKIETKLDGKKQQEWRPKAVYHYIQDYSLEPDFVVDTSDFFETKKSAILSFSSQFYDPTNTEPKTPISSKEFLNFVKARDIHYGRPIGAKYAEGFKVNRSIGVNDLFNLI